MESHCSRQTARSLGKYTRRAIAGIVALSALSLAPALADPYPVVVLQALDKISARVSVLEIAIGSSAKFGNLVITARHCDKRPPEETPESAAFLEIDEIGADDAVTRQFTGWMFASSPALSAMEHPVYDVSVIDCRNPASSSSDTAP